ncbi:MAG: DNA-binding response regulator [Nitratiruptor sp.]|nr:DNA-binding response regulator [Nitratiruptor sp.]NPA83716.1 response regulator transcription factor [Campylobacterota bacterium]
MKVVMIEDDAELAEILGEYLKRYGIEVENYEDPFIALSAIRIKPYDALILDLTLPGMDGLEILKKIREFSDIPIIISSARSDLSDKVLGLELGADDYLPKPYDPKELEARLKAITRRRVKKEEPRQTFMIYKNRREISYQGKILHLTPAEFEVLSFLIEHPNQPIDREELLYSCESLSENASEKTIDVIISRIRQKLGEDPKNPRHIVSVRGVGYKFVP